MREGSSSSGPTCCTAQVEATSTAIHCGGRGGRPLGRLLSPRSNDLNKPQRAQRAQRKNHRGKATSCSCCCSSLCARFPLWFVQGSCRSLCSLWFVQAVAVLSAPAVVC